MLGAVGELLGAAGVIVTLGYLASQIRQSRVASQQAAVAELLDQNQRILAQLSTSPDIARLWRRGMAADEGLSVDELFHFRALLIQVTNHWVRLYHFSLSGHVAPWIVESNRVARRDIVGVPVFRRWFEDRNQRTITATVADLGLSCAGPGALATSSRTELWARRSRRSPASACDRRGPHGL